MISNFLFERVVIPDLELGMNAYSKRQKVISNNIANASTPGYKAKDVSFEDEYAKHLNRSKIKGSITNSNHIPLGRKSPSNIRPEITYRPNTLNDTGINNVDIDQEMAELAKNSLRYEMSTILTNKRLANLKSSIRGRA